MPQAPASRAATNPFERARVVGEAGEEGAMPTDARTPASTSVAQRPQALARRRRPGLGRPPDVVVDGRDRERDRDVGAARRLREQLGVADDQRAARDDVERFKRLKAARLDNSVEAEMRRLAHVELLILDDFALQPLDATETTDFYELIVERHRKTSTVRHLQPQPDEWLAMMADPLLAQSAVDRLVSTAHELIIEGESYRRLQRPSIHHHQDVSVDQKKGDHHDHKQDQGGPYVMANPGPITLAGDS